MNPETKIQQRIMLALSEAGCVVWRNNVGQAWHGRVIHQAADQVTLAGAHKIPYGLCKGSSDLLSITPITITPDMVGETVGVFTAPEVKTPTGRVSKEQALFLQAVTQRGGIAGVVRSVEDALALIRQG